MDQLSNLNMGLAPVSLLLIDFVLINCFFLNLISIVAIVLHYLALIRLKLKQSFVWVIANVPALVSLDNTHFSDQLKVRLISKLIKVLQKLLHYFNCTIISTLFEMTWFQHWSFKFNLSIGVIRSTCIIICFNPILFSRFSWLIWWIA